MNAAKPEIKIARIILRLTALFDALIYVVQALLKQSLQLSY
jgi:hypothetical protein